MHNLHLGMQFATRVQRTMCIKRGFWPPVKPKIESYSTAFSLECFIRRMIEVFLFHIDLTLTVGMVSEMAAKKG